MQAYGKQFAKVYNERWTGFSKWLAPKIYELFESKLRKHNLSNTLLDLCCGTGKLANYFLKLEYSVVGVDLSPFMLKYAIDNNSEFVKKQKAKFIVADAVSFKLNTRVSFAVCIFDSLNHLASLDHIKSCFRQVHRYLNPNGYFLFDLNTRNGLLGHWNGMTFEDDEEIAIINRGIYSDGMDKAYTHITGFIRNADGTYDRFTQTAFNTAFSMQEIKEALHNSGFSNIYYASIDDLHNPIENPEALRRVFFICQKE